MRAISTGISKIAAGLGVMLMASSWVAAQDGGRIFTLEQAIDYALHKSFEVQSLGLSLESARQSLLASRGAFKTNAQMRFAVPNLVERVNRIDVLDELPFYRTDGTLILSGGLDINQPLRTNGLFTLTSELYQQRLSSFLADNQELKRREFFTSVRLQFRQPLFTPNTLKLGFEEANLNYRRAQDQIKRTELDVIYNVTQAFYGFHRAKRQLEIVNEELAQQQDAYDLAKKKFEAGLIPEVEALQTEVDLAQSQNRVFTAQRALQRQSDIFKQSIGMPLSEQITVETQMNFTPFPIDLERAIAHGMAHRAELRELAVQQRLQEIAVEKTDARSGFRAELSASYELIGVSDQFLPYNTSFGDLLRSSWNDLRHRPKNRGIVFSVSMPLWDSGVNAAEVRAARSQLDDVRLRLDNLRVTVEREIKDAVASVIEGQNRLQVLEKSQSVAARSYEISLARFNNGDITIQALALDRDRLTQTRMAYLGAYIDYQTAIADLKRKTLYDFEHDRSLVEEQ